MNMEKSTAPQTSLQLCRLPVRPEIGQGQTHPRVLADLNCKDTRSAPRTLLPGPATDVFNRVTDSHRKTSPLRPTPHETHAVALEKQLEGTRISRKADPHPKVTPHSSEVVASGRKHALRPAYWRWDQPQIHVDLFVTRFNQKLAQFVSPVCWSSRSQSCSTNFYRCIKRRVGHLGEHTARGTWSLQQSRFHINYLELKAVFFTLNEFQDLCLNQIHAVLITIDNTTVVAYINKEGGMRSGPLCALLWRILTWCWNK